MKKYLMTILCLYAALTSLATEDLTSRGNQASAQLKFGTKIAVADVYKILWLTDEEQPIDPPTAEDYQGNIEFDENGQIGWETTLSINDSLEYSIILYNGNRLPLNRITEVQENGNDSTVGFWFSAGVPLVYEESMLMNTPTLIQKEIKVLYAIPEQWLLDWQDTATYVINGTVNYDGSIFFEGGIAFFVEDDVIRINPETGEETIWKSVNRLSSLFRNISFYIPNGIHKFERFSGYYPLSDERFQEFCDVVEDLEPGGGGGRPTLPIDPRSIKHRLHSIVSQNITISYKGCETNNLSFYQDNEDGISQVPIYLSQVNDSTLRVYNLYGELSWVDVIGMHNDGSMFFFNNYSFDSDWRSIRYFSGDSITFQLVGLMSSDTISWGVSMPAGEYPLEYYYDNNQLYYTDGSTFYIPGSAIRGDVNRNGEITISDVTALINMLLSGESDAPVILGKEAFDCNQDNRITIADVTALISYLLSGTW